MSGNTIIRAARNSENPYAQIARAIFEDDRMSWRAKGLMGYLLSRKDDWKVFVGDLQKRSTDGRDACYKALDELGRAGYLERFEHREKGRIKGTEYVIHELPDSIRAASWNTVSGSAVSGKAVSGNTVSGKSSTSNKELKAITEERKHIPDLTADAAVSISRLVINLADLIPTPPQAPPPDQAQLNPQANASETNATSLDTVPGAAAGQPSKTVQRLMAVYNAHRKHLPAAESASTGREKALKRLIGQFGGPEAAALALADATQEVAADEFWMGKGWGLDNLLPKIAGKVDAWRARGQPVMGADPAAPPNVAFHVGQRVSYKRDQYDVEHVGATYIDLYDPVNGSSRIAFASSDFVAVKAIGGGA